MLKKNNKDDDWDIDPDYQNDVSENQPRRGLGRTDFVDLKDLRETVKQSDAAMKKVTYNRSSKSSCGYGGKLGVQKDRMDKVAVGNEYIDKVDSYSSQKDYSQGFGGKFGVETDRQHKATENWNYRADVKKHESQENYAKGFGGKYGVQKDRQDKSAVGWEHKEELGKHASQSDYGKDVGGKYEVQTDRQDKSAVSWGHKEEVEKHASQQDYKIGYGGKYGVQIDRQDKSAVGWGHREEVEKHSSQQDYNKGYGGKYGVQTDRQDKSAFGWEYKEEVEKIVPQQGELHPDQINRQYEDDTKFIASPFQKYRPEESTANWSPGPIKIQPPTDFQLKPIEIVKTSYKPEIKTLPKLSVKVATSTEETSKIFQKVDDHALQVSFQEQRNFKELIWQLIYARNITNDLEKVRAIFMWLCTKDLNKMNFDNIKQDSPEDILMGIRNGKSTYAEIFLTLCRYAELHCKLIVGYAKGVGYVPGMKCQGRKVDHLWNAVLIEGVWRLIDCNWGSRHLVGKLDKQENIRYKLDMFYFLTNPGQLIHTHFPLETEWQLLHHTINIEKFESLAYVTSMFFKYNLDLVTHKNAVIQSKSPEFELRIAFPKGNQERLFFTFKLSFEDNQEQYNDISLLQYGRQEFDFDNNHSCFWIRTPIPGAYKLSIFAKLIHTNPNIHENEKLKTFGKICEYKIDSDFVAKQALGLFPPCPSSIYGPQEMYKKYPIEAKNRKSSFYINNGTVEIKFLILKPDIRIMAELFSSQHKNSDQLTEQCTLQRLIGKEEVVIIVSLPEPGEYCLQVYASEPKTEGNSYNVVWNYFIVTNSASIDSGLPSLKTGYFGLYDPKFIEYGLSIYSHKDPFIIANTSDLCVKIKTVREKPVRVMAQLIHCSHNVSEMYSDNILQTGRDSIVSFQIRLPHQGFFKLQIFALPCSETSESLPGVFNYLIKSNQKSQNRIGFPKQFAKWKEGCYLYEPTDGILGINSKPNKITFRVSVMRAKSLAVIVNEIWTKLEKNRDEIWMGDVEMESIWSSPGTSELTVCANFDATMKNSFTNLLKYSIQK